MAVGVDDIAKHDMAHFGGHDVRTLDCLGQYGGRKLGRRLVLQTSTKRPDRRANRAHDHDLAPVGHDSTSQFVVPSTVVRGVASCYYRIRWQSRAWLGLLSFGRGQDGTRACRSRSEFWFSSRGPM